MLQISVSARAFSLTLVWPLLMFPAAGRMSLTGRRDPLRGRRVKRTGLPLALAIGATIAVFAGAAPTLAGVCTVPGTHSAIQAAIDDPACSQIQLAAQSYAESVLIGRSLALAGPGGGGAVVEGRFTARGTGVVVTVTDVTVENGCGPEAVSVRTGAALDGLGFEVVSASGSPCPVMLVFADGFESGDTAAWSSTVP